MVAQRRCWFCVGGRFFNSKEGELIWQGRNVYRLITVNIENFVHLVKRECSVTTSKATARMHAHATTLFEQQQLTTNDAETRVLVAKGDFESHQGKAQCQVAHRVQTQTVQCHTHCHCHPLTQPHTRMYTLRQSKGLQKLRWYCQMCQKQCRDENGFKCHCTSESHLRQMAIFAQKPGKVVDEFSEEFESTFMRLLSRRFGTRRVAANVVYNEYELHHILHTRYPCMRVLPLSDSLTRFFIVGCALCCARYIADKQHLHMNSTKWVTLTSFVQYLGRTGKCQIDQTEKVTTTATTPKLVFLCTVQSHTSTHNRQGWYIRWIDRDPATVARQKAALAMKKTELDETMRIDRRMKRLAEQAQAAAAAKG